VSTSYVDDLDGSQASGAVDFSLDGKSYAIDLSDRNAARLREALAPFVSAARRAGGPGRRASSPRPATAAPRRDLGEVREALRELGYTVKDRGRISADLMVAYENRTAAPAADSSEPKKKGRKKASTNGIAVDFQDAAAK
jgi:hypothetical protein